MASFLDFLPPLLKGANVTVQITLLAAVLGFVTSFAVGLARLSRYSPVRFFSGLYVEVIRGTSLLVQLFWMVFVLPLFGLKLPLLTAGVLALGLNCGAYGSEIVRGSILAVPKGQTEAAIALNLSPWQRMRLVIIPQAFRLMLPPFGNLFIELVKGTALVSLIALHDLTFQAMSLRNSTLETTKIFALLLLVYFLIAYPATIGIRWVEHRLSVGRY